MKKFISVLLIAILTFSIMVSSSIVFAASNIGIQTNSDHTSGRVNQSNDIVISVGSKVQLYAFIMEGVEVTGDPLSGVTWSTSNVQVVAISANGLITALKEGTATITASFDGGSDTIKVTVGSGTASNDEPTSGGSNNGGSTGGSGSGNTSNGGNSTTGDGYADFSNAKFEVKKDGISSAILKITGIKGVSDLDEFRSLAFLYITETNAKPVIDGLKVNGESWAYGKSFSKDKDNPNTLIVYGLEKYVELKKDYYFSVVQAKTYGNDLKVVSYGIKMERPAEPKYTDVFSATFTTYQSDQIVTTFTHDLENARKMQIKIGKITDTSILNKIKNKDASGFEDLLNYSRSASSIFDKLVNCDYDGKSAGQFIEYNAGRNDPLGHEVININKVEENAYYYLYIKTDDENGKYYSYEGITLAIASVPQGNPYLFYYGTDNFKWTDFGGGTLNGNLTKDPTTSNGKLPQTGIGNATTAGIVATIILTIISYVVYSKNKDIR